MTLTKKQLDAIRRIISSCEHHPAHKDRAGEMEVSDGAIITDGVVLIHAPESIGFKKPNRSDPQLAERMNRKYLSSYDPYSADFYMVEEPIPMLKTASTLRARLKERTFLSDNGQHTCVSLSAHDGRGNEIWSVFDYGSVVAAFEAVGKSAVGYIGNSGGMDCPRPYLIVEPDGDYGDPRRGIHALVLPVRTRREARP